MTNYKNITYFEGLNALRFIAAFMVIMHHAETIKKKNNLFNLEWFSLFRNGGNAVSFFFVLSGFLITYLLLKEHEIKNTICIKTFYIKRIRRIWPLYFLLVFIGTLIIPLLFNSLKINYIMPYTITQTWYYFLFFFPGLVTFFFGHHLLEPLWSIGVEELFYLIWAPLFKFFKHKILLILTLIIGTKISLKLLALFCFKNALFVYLSNSLYFEAMAIGSLGAYYIYNRTIFTSKTFLYKKPIQFLIYSTLFVFILFNVNITNSFWSILFKTPILSSIFIYCLFLYLIIGVAIAKNNFFKLQNKFINYLGEISYGIYMYHMIIVFGIIQVFKTKIATLSPLIGTLMFYSILFITVVAVSSISKKTLENYFLNKSTNKPITKLNQLN